ncbi:MAG: hypothetical protein JRI71_11805 [Deltaproteobacteria bacterium]|nr:hypothetical protein [Deltaproteobacteria bacterium]MBW2078210.1 hypothetical protein [Deltaproteobacteria bacterium]
MKVYEIKIRPISGFGTPLKGDTLFGHFCWQVAYDQSLLNGGLEKHISMYPERPFAVFSSAFPKLANSSMQYVLKRPDLPISFLFQPKEKEREKRILSFKEFKEKQWIVVKGELSIDLSGARFLSDSDLIDEISKQGQGQTRRQLRKARNRQFAGSFLQPHNTINRLTQTTGTGMFAPYAQEIIHYYPETELVLFVIIDESSTDIERICKALERIGNMGYGKDASIGMGRFKVGKHRELTFPEIGDSNACYTLAPSVPQKNCFAKIYFKPFTRFGKHGDKLARSANPFKKPVIMADEGAVLIPKDKNVFEVPYIGKAISEISKPLAETMVQGYSPYLPFKMENYDERILQMSS